MKSSQYYEYIMFVILRWVHDIIHEKRNNIIQYSTVSENQLKNIFRNKTQNAASADRRVASFYLFIFNSDIKSIDI